MPRWGMAIDLDKCSACQACTVACAAETNAPPGRAEEAAAGRLMRWLQILPDIEGEYPYLKASLSPMMCQQCENSPCTYVCPVSATYPNSEGIVAQIYWRCIGCRYCVNACPYTMKWFNWGQPRWPGALTQATNPDVELRDKGVTEKCTLCHHRLQRAREQARVEGRDLRTDEYIPACAEACPTQAIVFGDFNDPESEVSRLARSPRAFRYLEELGTKSKVIYLRER